MLKFLVCPANSLHPNILQADGVENAIDMFGDTTHTLILDGIDETQHEDLRGILTRCMNDIGVPINWDDIEEVARIGKYDKNRKWPKLILKNPSIRDQIFFFKSRLRFSNLVNTVRVSEKRSYN